MVLVFGIGLTDVVKGKAASSDALLPSSDYDVPGFIAKIKSFKPFMVAFNGKQAATRKALIAYPLGAIPTLSSRASGRPQALFGASHLPHLEIEASFDALVVVSRAVVAAVVPVLDVSLDLRFLVALLCVARLATECSVSILDPFDVVRGLLHHPPLSLLARRPTRSFACCGV